MTSTATCRASFGTLRRSVGAEHAVGRLRDVEQREGRGELGTPAARAGE
ncbi:MAG: hypothetical protein LC790_02480 [Actinobacteria bacterium]|nr:hypothetical protein [Actinomycetota bacterium]